MSDAGYSDLDHETVPSSAKPKAEEEDVQLFERLKGWYKDDVDHSSEWRTEAREDYDFVAQRQWSSDDLAYLRETNRPHVTFDRIRPMVQIVSGLEIGNRQEQRFIPRQEGAAGVNELLTAAGKWVRDGCDAEDEESEAFWDALVCGMGWTNSRLDYHTDPDGTVLIEQTDPLAMYWDCGSRKKNLADSRRLHYVKDMPLDEAKEMFPGFDGDDLHAGWADDLAADSDTPHDAQQAPFYRNNQSDKTSDKKSVRIVETQWWELETKWRIVDPTTGQKMTLKDDEYKTLKKRFGQIAKALNIPALADLRGTKQQGRCYYKAFLGAKVLEKIEGPERGGFTYKCITGYRDHNKGTWHGIVRGMKDPQRWVNKWVSQAMHILNSGAKGGIIAESDAFDNIRDAEEQWADPQEMVIANPGAVSGGKIMPRPPNPMPQGLADLTTLGLTSIRDGTGINLELLGMVEKEQAGILEHMRKQAGMTVLSSLFDSLRRYRKEQGRLMLWYITKFMSDDRLIKIGGPEDAKYIPLEKQDDTIEYDVVVDDTPTSPNMKERVWATVVQMMPTLEKAGLPQQVYLELMKFSPFPETVVAKISQILQQTQQQNQGKPDPNTIVAQGMAAKNMAQAGLYKAQTQKTMQDAMIGSHQVAAENAKTQVEAAKAVLSHSEARMKLEESKAKIENLRAAAIANLAKAGATQAGIQTDQYVTILDALDSLMGYHHTQQQIDNDTQSISNDAEAASQARAA